MGTKRGDGQVGNLEGQDRQRSRGGFLAYFLEPPQTVRFAAALLILSL